MPRKSTDTYPANWPQIAHRVKEEASWQCVRCGHPHHPDSGHMLTVHHLDMDRSNNRWHNLASLCQACHLHIQAKVVMEQAWLLEHSEWFKPLVAGYYAFHFGLPDDRGFVLAHVDELIALGQGRIQLEDLV